MPRLKKGFVVRDTPSLVCIHHEKPLDQIMLDPKSAKLRNTKPSPSLQGYVRARKMHQQDGQARTSKSIVASKPHHLHVVDSALMVGFPSLAAVARHSG